MVSEAFLKAGDNIQCGLEDKRLEEMKESNGNWKFWITVIIAIDIIFLAVVIFVVKRTVMSNGVIQRDADWRADNLEFRLTELSGIWKEMPFRWIMGRINTLHNYARRIHSGLILNGGFVEREIPNTHATSVYDMLNEMNAGHYLARRSLEEM